MLLHAQSPIGTEMHTLAAQIALKWCLLVRMSENDILRAYVHAGQTGYTFLAIDVVGALLVLNDGLHGAYLCALSALGAGAHLEDAWVWELGNYGQT
jgi:hypothetical protein